MSNNKEKIEPIEMIVFGALRAGFSFGFAFCTLLPEIKPIIHEWSKP